MSQANVETIRTVFEIFNREGFEPTRRFLRPDTVWHPFPEWPGEREYRGPDGAGRLVAEWTENFEDYAWEVEELLDAGDAVVLLGYHTGHSRGAEAPVSQRVSAVFSGFDDKGRTGEAWFYLSWEEAREKAASL